jgi:SAM-dependent methyltransferase
MNTRVTKEDVKQRYGGLAARVGEPATGGACCGSSAGCIDPISADLYDAAQIGALPEKAFLASLGCGNPTALAELRPGETVLDLGSGGGIDVLLSARRVGPQGMVYGLDMTDEMLALAEENKRQSGLRNVEFLRGEIENIPLPDDSVDVIISNCVINLSGDKDRVLREAFRVLKPGGRFAVSDVVLRGELPAEVRRSIELWVGCISGALSETEYRDKLAAAGFAAVDLEVTRTYRAAEARAFLAEAGIDADRIAPEVDGKVVSAFVRATKPAAKAEEKAACCGPACCA